MPIPQTIANFETTISGNISAGDVTFSIVSAASKHGSIPNGLYAATINEGKANEEHIIGELTGTTFASVVRDISVIDGATSKSTGKDHQAGDSIKMTNHPALIRAVRILRGEDELDHENPLGYDDTVDYGDELDAGNVTATNNLLATIAEVRKRFNKELDNILTGANVFQGNTTFEGDVDMQGVVTIPEGTLAAHPLTKAQIEAIATGNTPLVAGFDNATITYDGSGRVSTITDNDYSITYTITWNADDNVASITDGTYTWTLTYNVDKDITNIVKTLN